MPLGNLTYGKEGRLTLESQPPQVGVDVTSIVSSWESFKYRTNYGFIVANTLPVGAHPIANNACVVKYATPTLRVVYF